MSEIQLTNEFGTKREGVRVKYSRRSRKVTISAWYDSIVGICPMEMDLETLLKSIGVSRSDLRRMIETW